MFWWSEVVTPARFLLGVLCLVGCSDPLSVLVVDVRTELIVGVEFDSVRTEVLTGDASGRFLEHTSATTERYGNGVRVAELGELTHGSVTVRVSLMRGSTLVLQRPVRVELTGPLHGVTLLLPRDCLGVECPLAGGDPVASACVGGTCQDERCTEETPEFCEPECAEASECAGGSSCAVAECSNSGSCFLAADDAMCGGVGETCDLVDGCIGGEVALCPPFPGSDLALHVAAHSACVSSSDEPLRCWGEASGMFGEPFDVAAQEVRVVLPDARFDFFTLGSGFHCGVDQTGELRCVGSDWGGQLGDGVDSSPSSVQVPVLGMIPTPLATLHSGISTTCAIANGQTFCWGTNGAGQVGDGTQERAWIPAEVVGGHTFASVVAGENHTCGITNLGTLYCWGTNSSEELAESVMVITEALEPRQVGSETNWVAVSPGNGFTLALNDANDVYSWGANYAGQLGRPSDGGTATVAVVATELDVRLIEAGWRHGCLITTDDNLYCWGDATWGQVGPNGPSGESMFQPEPILVMPERRFVDVDTGQSHTCALDDTGRVWCWGDNTRAQLTGPLGLGSPEPAQVCLPTG